MEPSREPPETLRTFFALLPDEAAVDFLCDQLVSLKRAIPYAPVRWVWPEKMHLTLRFLGETRSDRDSMRKLILRAHTHAHFVEPFSCRIGPPRLFPNPRRPSVVTAEIEASPGLLRLAERTEMIAVDCGFAPGSRKFRPHLTLGRIRRGSRFQLPSIKTPGIEFEANEMVLMKSEQTRDGSVYTPIERFPLGRT